MQFVVCWYIGTYEEQGVHKSYEQGPWKSLADGNLYMLTSFKISGFPADQKLPKVNPGHNLFQRPNLILRSTLGSVDNKEACVTQSPASIQTLRGFAPRTEAALRYGYRYGKRWG